jgi:hypothetical protein
MPSVGVFASLAAVMSGNPALHTFSERWLHLPANLFLKKKERAQRKEMKNE